MSGDIIRGIDFNRRRDDDAYELAMDVLTFEMMREADLDHPRPGSVVDYETFIARRVRKVAFPDMPRSRIQLLCDCC